MRLIQKENPAHLNLALRSTDYNARFRDTFAEINTQIRFDCFLYF